MTSTNDEELEPAKVISIGMMKGILTKDAAKNLIAVALKGLSEQYDYNVPGYTVEVDRSGIISHRELQIILRNI